ncbi:MAG: nucleoside kinase [Clostridia bacterium]|nr:nucleoside kinase [Clostridia bacterium]
MNYIDIEKLNLNAINNLPDLILEDENSFSNQIANISKEICKNPNIKIILLAGPSASGKTTSSSLLSLNLKMLGKKVLSISLDNFFLAREKTPKLPDGSLDFECLQALDLPYLKKFINDLLTKNSAKMPIYNFLKGKPEEEKEDIVVDNNTIIIFEGLHALNPAIIENNKSVLKLYISLNSDYVLDGKVVLSAQDVRLMRRITRDHYTRGYNPEETLNLWKNVIAGEKIYVLPFKHLADYTINSSHPYEPLLYANYTKKILKEHCKNNKKLQELIQALETFEPIDKTLLPSTSLLWEFVNSAK